MRDISCTSEIMLELSLCAFGKEDEFLAKNRPFLPTAQYPHSRNQFYVNAKIFCSATFLFYFYCQHQQCWSNIIIRLSRRRWHSLVIIWSRSWMGFTFFIHSYLSNTESPHKRKPNALFFSLGSLVTRKIYMYTETLEKKEFHLKGHAS